MYKVSKKLPTTNYAQESELSVKDNIRHALDTILCHGRGGVELQSTVEESEGRTVLTSLFMLLGGNEGIRKLTGGIPKVSQGI